MALGDTGGDDDALPPLEELSGVDASPGNGAGARGYDFNREDRRRARREAKKKAAAAAAIARAEAAAAAAARRRSSSSRGRGGGRAATAGAAQDALEGYHLHLRECAKSCAMGCSGKNKLATKGGGRHGGGAGHRGGGGGSGSALSMSLGDTSGDDDALPPLEELSGADASPGNGAGARGYDFDREDRRRGVRGARHDEVPVLRVYIDNPRRTVDTMLFMRDAFSTPNGVQP